MIKANLKFKKGFTLIEVLMVTCILGIISVTVLATFSSGLAVYGRIQNFGHEQIDILLALERMERDIRNTFYFDALPFDGSPEEMSFSGINTVYDESGGEGRSLGKFYYHFDNFKKKLEVDWQPYSSVVAGNVAQGGFKETLADIEGIQFKYYFYSEEDSQGVWSDEWNDKTKLPRGVEIKIEALYGEQRINLARKIFIPASIMIKEEEEEEEDEDDDVETPPYTGA